ncbi:MAG: leucine-rich repeat domain-containing protein [Ureaplasma sp.]|nr:leucine-rich repeat domain-containing protein [Ureaplasma sp.]
MRIPGSVKTLVSYVFYDSRLSTFYLEEGINSIFDFCFQNVAGLNNRVYLPNSCIDGVDVYAFYNLGTRNIGLVVKSEEMKQKLINKGLKGVTGSSITVQNWN